ncbi:MAG: abortive infection family protein [Methylobacter sp.]
MLEELQTDLERAQALQAILVARATGTVEGGADYNVLRTHLLGNATNAELLPSFVRTNRTLEQFWQFIKGKFLTYSERRRYIWGEFSPLLDHLERKELRPLDVSTSATLKSFDEESVHAVWQKALERRKGDPEGAITTARTLLETICKHILDQAGIFYDSNKIELHELYKLTANELNISPSQHSEEVFRQILGGCSAIVNGLGTLRNRLGDAHGKGQRPAKPQARHAELAVNLAGAMGLFLVSTWQSKSQP